MKKILILGAGIYQVPLIQAAKRMGLYTIVASIPGNYPGFALADKVYYENTVDYDKIIEIARDEKIDGVVTAGTDVAVITVGAVCDALGLRGLSAEAAKIASNKSLMKEKYEEFGVSTARFRRINVDDEDYADKLAGLEFPLIFKSVDSSGSRGITRVDSTDEFAAARENVLANTRSDNYIVEEFIEGDEFGAQAFVQDGEIEFILPHGDYVFHGDTGVPIGHYAPFDVDAEAVKEIKLELGKAIRSMKLDNCAINADFIMKDGKAYVLEIGGRSGATCLAELTSIYYGFDYYEKILRVALGEHVDFSCAKDEHGEALLTPNACMLLQADKTGTIQKEWYEAPDGETYAVAAETYVVGTNAAENGAAETIVAEANTAETDTAETNIAENDTAETDIAETDAAKTNTAKTDTEDPGENSTTDTTDHSTADTTDHSTTDHTAHVPNTGDPDIVDVQFDYRPGDSVRLFHVGPDRIGHVIAKGHSLDAAIAKMNQALENVHIEIE